MSLMPMPPNAKTKVSKVEKIGSAEKKWIIENFFAEHKVIVAAGASCYVEVGNPKIGLRFFLREHEKLTIPKGSVHPFASYWYSICCEVTSPKNENAAIEVSVRVCGHPYSHSDIVNKDGTIAINESKGNIFEVINPFMSFVPATFKTTPDIFGCAFNAQGCIKDARITIKAEVFRLIEIEKCE